MLQGQNPMGKWSKLPSFHHRSFLKISSYTGTVLTWALYIGRGLESKSRHARSGIEWPRVGQNYMRSAGRAAIPAHVEGVNSSTRSQYSDWRMSAVQCSALNNNYTVAIYWRMTLSTHSLSLSTYSFRLQPMECRFAPAGLILSLHTRHTRDESISHDCNHSCSAA